MVEKIQKKQKDAGYYLRIANRIGDVQYGVSDLLSILDIHWSSSLSELKYAWRSFASVMHPDRHGNDAKKTEVFRRFLFVYNQIKTESDLYCAGSEAPVYDIEKNAEELIHIYVERIKNSHE